MLLMKKWLNIIDSKFSLLFLAIKIVSSASNRSKIKFPGSEQGVNSHMAGLAVRLSSCTES